MGCQLKWHEPVVHNISLSDVEAVQRFHTCGWLGYFLQLNEANEEVPIEFMRTFDEGQATIQELTIIATEERIAEVTRLPTIGEHYPNAHDARSAKAQFTQANDPPLEILKQGCK